MLKNIEKWIFTYLKLLMVRKLTAPITNIAFCICDHFEPAWNKADHNTEVVRVDKWISEYPKIADKHKDCNGRKPQYTFFYPEEEYRKEHLDKLVKLCKETVAVLIPFS